MKENGHTSQFVTTYSGVTLTLMGFLFVDDTDLIVLGEEDESADTVLTRLQNAITFWNGVLNTSGGALRPEKCYWYFFSFKWVNGIATISNTAPGNITLPDATGEPVPIRYLSPSDSAEAVGVWQDGDGSSTRQFEELIKKIRTIHTALDNNPLPRHLIWMGFKQAIWASISYVLPAMSLTLKDSLILNRELYRSLLPKIGCNRNFPLLLRYNPPYLTGLGLFDTFVEQGLAKID